MQPILIDLDGTSDFLFVVRIRGVLCQAINPLRADMSIFDERVKRSDHAGEDELRAAIGDLAHRMIEKMFEGSHGWRYLLDADLLHDDPLGRYESLVIVGAFLGAATAARGEDARPFVDGSFSLIAEDDPIARAKAKAAANLPPGRVIGTPITTAPQPGAAAAS